MKFIMIIIIAGILGFVASVIIFTYSKSESPFYEINIAKKKTETEKILNGRVKNLSKKAKDLNLIISKIDSQVLSLASKKKLGDNELIANKKEEKKINTNKLKVIENNLNKSIKERNELVLLNADIDTTYYTKYFSVDRSSFFETLNLENFNTDTTAFKKYIKFHIIDPTLIPSELEPDSIIKGLAILEKVTYKNKVSFVNKYPAFGFWLVLSIGQACIWFIVGAIIILLFLRRFYSLPNITKLDTKDIKESEHKVLEESKRKELNEQIETNKAIVKEERWKIFDLVVLVVLVVGLFLFFTYSFMIDAYVIEDHLFMENFSFRMFLYALIGYCVAGLCFFIYLYTAFKVHQLEELNKDSDNLSTETKSFIETDLNHITSTFDYSFAFSALILSIFVIWLGIMFNAINSLDLMNYYYQISGKHFLNNDYVYLVGLLHSLLLLIFYIPVQIKFNSLKIIKQQKKENEASNEDTSTFKKVFNGLFQNISPVLITASPLISSFIQNLITSFINE